MTTPTIERHPGIAVGPYIVGGGYSGTTEELDTTVQHAAEMMLAEFSRPIEIRFNSDRRSGKAFLKNNLPGFSASCQLGLGAELWKVRPEGLTDEQYWDMPRPDFHALPDELRVTVLADADCLFDQADANQDGGTGSHKDGYAYLYFVTPEDGLEWIRGHVDYSKLRRGE